MKVQRWDGLPAGGVETTEHAVFYGTGSVHHYAVTGGPEAVINIAHLWGNGAWAGERLIIDYENGWQVVGPWIRIQSELVNDAVVTDG